MDNRNNQDYAKPEYNRFDGLELQSDSIWLRVASEFCSAKLAIAALLLLVLIVDLPPTAQIIAIVGIIALGAWSSPLRWKHAKSKTSTAAGSDESDYAAKREGSA